MADMLDEARERLAEVDLRGRIDDGLDIPVPLKAKHIRALLKHLIDRGRSE